MTETSRTYPRQIDCGGSAVVIDRMTSADQKAVEQFVAQLPAEDLLFVPRDIAHPKVMAAWMQALETGGLHSLVARRGDQVVGCTSLYTDPLGWSRHVGELRVLVAEAMRGKGLGRMLIQECFVQGLGLGLSKLMARMTTSQTGAVGIFEDMGFHAEALLRGQVMDRHGDLHDLVVLSHDVQAVAARHAAYGMDSLGTA